MPLERPVIQTSLVIPSDWHYYLCPPTFLLNAAGSWERSDISRLDESALSKPASRFPLNDSGLSGTNLNAARAICALWNNEKWMHQAPMSGLSPITLIDGKKNAILRQIAELTRVKAGEATPDGLPSIVLNTLREAISHRKLESGSAKSLHGWSQSKTIPLVLEILKRKIGSSEATGASSPSSSSNQSIYESKNVRRKVRGGSWVSTIVFKQFCTFPDSNHLA